MQEENDQLSTPLQGLSQMRPGWVEGQPGGQVAPLAPPDPFLTFSILLSALGMPHASFPSASRAGPVPGDLGTRLQEEGEARTIVPVSLPQGHRRPAAALG